MSSASMTGGDILKSNFATDMFSTSINKKPPEFLSEGILNRVVTPQSISFILLQQEDSNL